mgnify:CR=1 FL=1
MRNESLREKPGGSCTKKSFQHVKERRILNPNIRGKRITNSLECFFKKVCNRNNNASLFYGDSHKLTM